MTVRHHAPHGRTIQPPAPLPYEPPYTWIAYRASRSRAYETGGPACPTCGCETGAAHVPHSPRCSERAAE